MKNVNFPHPNNVVSCYKKLRNYWNHEQAIAVVAVAYSIKLNIDCEEVEVLVEKLLASSIDEASNV